MRETPTDKELKEFVKGLLLGVVFGTLLGGFLGVSLEEAASKDVSDDLYKEAVERGYAEWRLTHAHNGATEFRWLDKPSPPSPDTVLPPQPE